jgi:hypothetical protein
MGMTHDDATDDATDQASAGANGRAHATVVALGAVAAASLLYVGVGWFVGMPGPGPVRRYPASELERLAAQLDHTAEPTYDSCRRTVERHPVAHVDHLRSRVVLEVGSAPPSLDPELRAMIVPNDDQPRFQAVICDFSGRRLRSASAGPATSAAPA